MRAFFLTLLIFTSLCFAAEGSNSIRVLAWSERTEPASVYPNGINGQFAAFLKEEKQIVVTTANLSDPEQGLSERVLASTDVLIWFGHKQHALVTDENVERIMKQVRERGMGFLPIHSAHYSKPFQRIMKTIAMDRGTPLTGTPGKWDHVKAAGDPETIHVLTPEHPIARGVKDFLIPQTETYWNPFIVPPPDVKILAGQYKGDFQDGSDGMLWKYGKGEVFYFRPGHETYPIYFQPEVQQILKNAIRYLAASK